MKSVLKTHDLTIGYITRQNTTIVADNLSLTLRSGEMACLLGPNGAGKSTLMRTIAGVQPPLAGQITLMGDDLTNLTPQERSTRLSVVLTERPNLGLLNGYALVALGRHPYTDWTGRLSRYDEAMIRWAIEAVDAIELAEQPVMQLSDGQRQKLMIARALAQESELILLDEPTAYLDLPRRVETMRLLKQLAAETGRAILLSTHDLDLALRSADTLWLMSEGRVAAGTPEDLVLSGAFEAAFRSAGVPFDRQTGAFQVAQASGKIIIVEGEGLAYTWTCRALTRLGYTFNDRAPLRVTVSGEAQPMWYLDIGGRQSKHTSIDALLSALSEMQFST